MLQSRLIVHKLVGSDLREPADVVAWLCAVQAQDFPGARWALGLRANGLTDLQVLRAYDDGSILRTHVLRPTWHLVTPADIRWQLALTGARVMSGMASRHRQLELDARVLSRSRSAIARALEGGRALTRAEVGAALQSARITVTPERLGHLLMVAELEALICSGPLRSGRHTYALLEERVPRVPSIGRDDALQRLARRYFQSHAPASATDFAWWSGLSVREAKIGMALAGMPAAATPRSRRAHPLAWLLPAYDEYLVAYRDRAEVLGPHVVDPREALAPTVLIDGRAIGNWRRVTVVDGMSIELLPRRRLAPVEAAAVQRAVRRYGAFLDRDVSLVTAPRRPAARSFPRAGARQAPTGSSR